MYIYIHKILALMCGLSIHYQAELLIARLRFLDLNLLLKALGLNFIAYFNDVYTAYHLNFIAYFNDVYTAYHAKNLT